MDTKAILFAAAAILGTGPAAHAQTASENARQRSAALTLDHSSDAPDGGQLDLAADTVPKVRGASSSWKKPSFFAAIVGGAHVETLQRGPSNQQEDRTTTVALSRLGVRGPIADGISVESEFEVNSGPHGTSVWEGQAALQVRNQLVRLKRSGFRLDAGRVTDPSSLDFTSMHLSDQLLTDPYTRGSLLASGFNRGQGIYAAYAPIKGLSLGMALNAANPTSTTASLVIGGTFPPFSRFYVAAYQQVGRDASSFPADQYHLLMASPSLRYLSKVLDAQASVQLFKINTDTNAMDDQNIIGYNLRGGLRLKFLDESIVPFANASRVENSMVEPDDGRFLSTEAFIGYTLGGGADWTWHHKLGAGVQYVFLRGIQGDISRTTDHVANIGASYFLNPQTSAHLRAAMVRSCVETPTEACQVEGARSYFLTLRTIL